MRLIHVMAGAMHGGAETFSMDLVNGLHKAGYEQIVITRPFESRIDMLRKRGISYKTLPFGNLFDFSTKKSIQGIIDIFKPDIVQTYMGRASSYHTPRTAKAGKYTDYKHIGWFGGYYNLKRFQDCDAYVGVTYDIADHIKKEIAKRGENIDKARAIHTFADLKLDQMPLNRADYNTPDDAKIFCALARLHWKKGLDTLLDAFVPICEKDPDAYLWIAGEGEDREKLETQMRDLGLEDKVRFLGWQDDRAAVLNASDFCVFPSRYEPFGTVMVEAWATKTPIIAAASQGPAAYMKNNENGLLIAVDDTEALTHSMLALLSDQKLCDTIVAGGWNTYQSMFTEDVIVETYLELYESLLDSDTKAVAV